MPTLLRLYQRFLLERDGSTSSCNKMALSDENLSINNPL